MAKNINLTELEKQAAFMRKMLDAQARVLENTPFTVEYDNGGGQKGTRENPEWAAYERLMKTYHATLRAIAAQNTGKPSAKTTGIGSPLTNFRGKYDGLRVVKDA